MRTWLVIVAVGAGSYLLRGLPVLTNPGWARSPRFARMITHAATSALAALCAVGLRRQVATPADLVAVAVATATALYLAVRGRTLPVVLGASGAAFTLLHLTAALS